MSDLFKPILTNMASGEPLDLPQAIAAFELILSGEADLAQMGAFLMALRMRGETPTEISAGAQVLRSKMVRVDAPLDAIDIVGTGGDGAHTYNISTAVAFVVAGAGVHVAKHGNRAVSSQSGAADVLAALGINLNLTPIGISQCISEANVGFMFAPNHHAAVRHVAPARAALGLRTIFNILGPLCNPANVQRYVLGVYDKKLIEPIAVALKNLGAERAVVVHGADGLDEFSPTGTSEFAILRDGMITRSKIHPEDLGLKLATLGELRGGDAQHNAQALIDVLHNNESAYATSVVMNAAVAFVVAGKCDDYLEGVQLAQNSLRSGAAARSLEMLKRISNEFKQ